MVALHGHAHGDTVLAVFSGDAVCNTWEIFQDLRKKKDLDEV